MRKSTLNSINNMINMDEISESLRTLSGNIQPDRLGEDGNSKLMGNILTWSISPVRSCLNCSDCATTCYAMKLARQYKNSGHKWDQNYELAKHNSPALRALIDGQISDYQAKRQGKRTKNDDGSDQIYFRIHVSGDFFSQDYLEFWKDLARDHEDVQFWSYSKTFDILDFSDLPSNMNIINSLPEGRLNFGSPEYIEDLMQDLPDARVCPVTSSTDKDDVKCVKDCKLCINHDTVLFHQH